jgi:hypothetical protein
MQGEQRGAGGRQAAICTPRIRIEAIRITILYTMAATKRRKILTRFSWTKQDGKIRSYV